MKERNEYIKQYLKDKNVRVSLNLSKEKDQDIIQAIEKERQGNKQAGVKSLIRKGIKYEESQKKRLPPIYC